MASSSRAPFRLGVVRYLNTLPLIDGLEHLNGLVLRHEVPARLIDCLERGDVDMALCSSVDLAQSAMDLQIVPAGCLACHGETLTVRLFSRVPLERISRLAADVESHTSVILAGLLLRELHGIAPEISPWSDDAAARDWTSAPDALLLIGDKAVLHAPPESAFPVRLDLGEAWNAMTGLPFVFAVWMTRADLALERRAALPAVIAALDHQRRRNRARLPALVAHHAAARGWPTATAQRYLSELLEYDFTARHGEALDRFLTIASHHGLIARRPSLVYAPEAHPEWSGVHAEAR